MKHNKGATFYGSFVAHVFFFFWFHGVKNAWKALWKLHRKWCRWAGHWEGLRAEFSAKVRNEADGTSEATER